jgi:hypothetical protein
VSFQKTGPDSKPDVFKSSRAVTFEKGDVRSGRSAWKWSKLPARSEAKIRPSPSLVTQAFTSLDDVLMREKGAVVGEPKAEFRSGREMLNRLPDVSL